MTHRSGYYYWKARLEIRAARAYRQQLPSRPILIRACLDNARHFRDMARQLRKDSNHA